LTLCTTALFSRPRRRIAAALAAGLWVGSVELAGASPRVLEVQAREPAKPEAPPSERSTDAAPPYEPQLMRLSEILGTLTYLRDLCGAKDGDTWRGRMSALLEAEAKSGSQRERLAGAYNRGLRGYSITYRVCTPNAQAIISRFLEEASRIARDVASRYGQD